MEKGVVVFPRHQALFEIKQAFVQSLVLVLILEDLTKKKFSWRHERNSNKKINQSHSLGYYFIILTAA